MDFRHSDRSLHVQELANRFLDEHVYPAEATFEAQAAQFRRDGNPYQTPAILADLKKTARDQKLWKLFLPDAELGAGLTVLDYAPISELTGRSPSIAPEAMNCAAPDTGNMELLSLFATPQQREQWLMPLLNGDIRSCFSMTEPAVASSDATNIATRIERDGDDYIVTGTKWWSSGALRPECKLAIVMAVSNPDADRHRRQSMILVPLDTPGVTIERSTSVYGYDDGTHGGHGVIRYEGVRVPATNLLGEEGSGFALAQARLGPGRIHHCMRSIGLAERALELMCIRAMNRKTFGQTLADNAVVQQWIAESRIELDVARLLVLKAAWMIDEVGAAGARTEIAAIKVIAPRAALNVIDRAVQAHGGAGVSGDFPLAQSWAHVRTIRIVDGPDEVHLRSIARQELRAYQDHAARSVAGGIPKTVQ